MCYSAESSAFNFIFGLITAFLVYKYGNSKYSNNNLIYGIFLSYVIIMQLFDFIFWTNQNRKSLINKVFTYIAAFFVYSQPSVLYLIKVLVKKPKFDNTDVFYLVINLFYLYVIYTYYISFMNDKPIITMKKGKHLKWKWVDHANILYFILFGLNIFYLSDIKYSLMICFFIFGSLFLSYKLFPNYIGEIWCYLAALAPILILLSTYLI